MAPLTASPQGADETTVINALDPENERIGPNPMKAEL